MWYSFSFQGERKLKDLNIIEMAKGPNEAWNTSFPVIVDDNPLEIHFFWAGKGSLRILNGPLVSAISVTPSKEKHILLILYKLEYVLSLHIYLNFVQAPKK